MKKYDGEEYTKIISNDDILEKARDLFYFFTGLRYSDMVLKETLLLIKKILTLGKYGKTRKCSLFSLNERRKFN